MSLKNELHVEYEKCLARRRTLNKMLVETRAKMIELEKRLFVYANNHSQSRTVLDHQSFYKDISAKIHRRHTRDKKKAAKRKSSS